MNIQMIGIDHTTAPVDVRQEFSFTKKATGEALAWLKEQEAVSGAVLLSTCNRMELWISFREGFSDSAKKYLFQLKKTNQLKKTDQPWSRYFVERKNQDAVKHLFRLAGGLESRILGEDQILTQVKEAAAFSRERGGTDQVLEVLFRMAVTAGKKIKSEIPMHKANYSAAHLALEALQAMGDTLAGRECLVIGNGEMGRLTALALLAEGAKVTMTVRQYRSGGLEIPEGCGKVNYMERYEQMKRCSLIVSATASPNYTVTAEGFQKMLQEEEQSGQEEEQFRREEEQFRRAEEECCVMERQASAQKRILIDLAVPRDIEPSVGGFSGVRLYDIDSFHIEARSGEMQKQVLAAEAVIEEKVKEFQSWHDCRDLIPRVQKISGQAARDAVWRTGKTVNGLMLSEHARSQLELAMEEATAKVVGKLMFELRDSLDTQQFRECVDALEQVYP